MAARYQASSEAAIIGPSAACGATVLDGDAGGARVDGIAMSGRGGSRHSAAFAKRRAHAPDQKNEAAV